MLSDLEKRFFERDMIYANDTYITDGVIVLVKKYIKNNILKQYIKKPKELTKKINKIPYDKGSEIELTKVFTQCKLLSDNKIGIILDDNNYADYDILLMLEDYYWLEYLKELNYTVQDFLTGKIVKFFDQDENFLGCFLSIKL